MTGILICILLVALGAVLAAFVSDGDFFGLARTDPDRYCPRCRARLKADAGEDCFFGIFGADASKKCPKCGHTVKCYRSYS